jgi:uncharacterized protein YcbX
MTFGPLGPVGDREWMLVDRDGQFLSQRKHPKMALIAPTTHEWGLRVSTPSLDAIDVEHQPGDATLAVTIHGSTLGALPITGEINQWASDFLGTHAQLVAVATDHQRAVNPKYAPADRSVGFADGYPLLVTSTGSLDDLVSHADQPFGMDRFRPNIVVEGTDPWVEDQWQQISVGGTTITIAKPCPRCPIPNVDQSTGTRQKEPARVLAKTRRREEDGATLFGVNAIHDEIGATIALGDAVRVLR